jgi:hypothetical protein
MMARCGPPKAIALTAPLFAACTNESGGEITVANQVVTATCQLALRVDGGPATALGVGESRACTRSR